MTNVLERYLISFARSIFSLDSMNARRSMECTPLSPDTDAPLSVPSETPFLPTVPFFTGNIPDISESWADRCSSDDDDENTDLLASFDTSFTSDTTADFSSGPCTPTHPFELRPHHHHHCLHARGTERGLGLGIMGLSKDSTFNFGVGDLGSSSSGRDSDADSRSLVHHRHGLATPVYLRVPAESGAPMFLLDHSVDDDEDEDEDGDQEEEEEEGSFTGHILSSIPECDSWYEIGDNLLLDQISPSFPSPSLALPYRYPAPTGKLEDSTSTISQHHSPLPSAENEDNNEMNDFSLDQTQAESFRRGTTHFSSSTISSDLKRTLSLPKSTSSHKGPFLVGSTCGGGTSTGVGPGANTTGGSAGCSSSADSSRTLISATMLLPPSIPTPSPRSRSTSYPTSRAECGGNVVGAASEMSGFPSRSSEFVRLDNHRSFITRNGGVAMASRGYASANKRWRL